MNHELTIVDITSIETVAVTMNAGLTIELRVVPVDRYHISKPDADKLAKLAMNVLKKTGGLGTLDYCAHAKLEVGEAACDQRAHLEDYRVCSVPQEPKRSPDGAGILQSAAECQPGLAS